MARQTFRVLDFVRRLEDDRLFGPGEEIDLDPTKANIPALLAAGQIAPLAGGDPLKDKSGDK